MTFPMIPLQPPQICLLSAGLVRDAIYHLGVPDGINIYAISPGKPTAQTRAMLDLEYAWWLPPLAVPNGRQPGRRSGAPRVRTGQPGSSSRKRCACNVLSDSCEVEPSPVPMALQEPYWRGVFQQESTHDDRRTPPEEPVEWSLVAPLRWRM